MLFSFHAHLYSSQPQIELQWGNFSWLILLQGEQEKGTSVTPFGRILQSSRPDGTFRHWAIFSNPDRDSLSASFHLQAWGLNWQVKLTCGNRISLWRRKYWMETFLENPGHRDIFLYYTTRKEVRNSSNKATLLVRIDTGSCNSTRIGGFE